MGADGVSGLIQIKAAGGLSIIQSPGEAAFPVMPANAISEDDVDGVLPLTELAAAPAAVASGKTVGGPAGRRLDPVTPAAPSVVRLGGAAYTSRSMSVAR
jgi:hypothetical protein